MEYSVAVRENREATEGSTETEKLFMKYCEMTTISPKTFQYKVRR